MIALDTNVAVRMFIDDKENPQQIEWVRQLIQQQEAIYISQVVQVEMVWVLETVYELSKSEIIGILQAIFEHTAIQLEKAEQFLQALHLFQVSKADFSDYIIFINSQSENCDLWTFDKNLSATQGVFRLNDESLKLKFNR